MQAVLLIALLAAPQERPVATIYIEAWNAAVAAYAVGGSPESLVPVREAIVALERVSGGRMGPAEIARLVLLAAAAAAQSERDEMAVYLTHAVEMESLQRAAGQPGAPGLSALEAAGDLWLQVYRYDEARAAYERAAREIGMTPRVKAGLARLEGR